MELLVNQSTGKIENSYLNTVPINITTDIQLETRVKTKSDQMYDDNNNPLYITQNGDITTEALRITQVNDEFDFNNASVIEGSITQIDEEIQYAECEQNDAYLKDVEFISLERVNESNAYNYNIDYILDQEILNLLNDSNYDNAIYDLMDSLFVNESTFYSKNKYGVILAANNMAVIKQYLDAGVKINNVEIFGIDPSATVLLNNISLTSQDNHFVGTNLDISEILELKIKNTGTDLLEINYPFILFN